jgi:2-haloacid dehalogenase
MPITALVFDAYGTLFDVASVERAAAKVVDDAPGFTALWRAKQLEYTFLRTLMDRYAPFDHVTADALDYALARFGVDLDPHERDRLLAAWQHVEPFPDAEDTLRELAHYRRAILSNGTRSMLQAALDQSGLDAHIEAIISVDELGVFKPRREVYALAARTLGCQPHEIEFVSANGWDIAGAGVFGFRTCWINRSELPVERLGVEPNAILPSLAALPEAIAQASMNTA